MAHIKFKNVKQTLTDIALFSMHCNCNKFIIINCLDEEDRLAIELYFLDLSIVFVDL